MAWIESHTVLMRHRKVIEMAKELRIRRSYVIGHLHALWHATLEQAEDGDLSQWSDELIAELADYNGDAPQFVQLLQKHGFLDGKLIHDWTEYAGRYLDSKYRTSNPKKLRDIYKKHGGQTKAKKKSDFSQSKVSPPNLPNLDNLPNLKRSEKLKFGKLQNCYLTAEEFQKLKEKFGGHDNAMVKIERLSLYVASKGDKYKSHYATILAWDLKDRPEQKFKEFVPKPVESFDTRQRCYTCHVVLVNDKCPACGADFSPIPMEVKLQKV